MTHQIWRCYYKLVGLSHLSFLYCILCRGVVLGHTPGLYYTITNNIRIIRQNTNELKFRSFTVRKKSNLRVFRLKFEWWKQVQLSNGLIFKWHLNTSTAMSNMSKRAEFSSGILMSSEYWTVKHPKIPPSGISFEKVSKMYWKNKGLT